MQQRSWAAMAKMSFPFGGARLLFVVLPLLAAAGARADTAVQSGLWEKTEKVTLDSRELPARPRSVCLKEGDASLERLLLVNDDEAKARGCTSEVAPLEAGRV